MRAAYWLHLHLFAANRNVVGAAKQSFAAYELAITPAGAEVPRAVDGAR